MRAFITWDDWQKITPAQRQMVELYGGDFRRNSAGIAFEIEQGRIDEILSESQTCEDKPRTLPSK